MANRPVPAHQILLESWAREEIPIQTRRVSAEEIALFEQRHSIVFPPAFRDYLRNASPLNDPSYDDEITDWWCFEKLQPVSDGYDSQLTAEIAPYADTLILFADFMIWCWAWAINCAPGPDYGRVVVIGGSDRFVADSFAEFVGKYLTDSVSVFPREPRKRRTR